MLGEWCQVKQNSQVIILHNEKELFTFLASKIYEFTSTRNQGIYAAALGETVVSIGSNNPAM